MYDASSPLDVLRKEISALKRSNQMRTDVRVLDLQLKNRNHHEFLKERDLLIQFRQRYPHQ
jgi:hypothetical protein